MIPGGADVKVTNANKLQYVSLQTQRILCGSNEQTLKNLVRVCSAFVWGPSIVAECPVWWRSSGRCDHTCSSRLCAGCGDEPRWQGVRDVLTPAQLKMFTPEDLQVMVGGPFDIVVKDLVKVVHYDGYVLGVSSHSLSVPACDVAMVNRRTRRLRLAAARRRPGWSCGSGRGSTRCP